MKTAEAAKGQWAMISSITACHQLQEKITSKVSVLYAVLAENSALMIVMVPGLGSASAAAVTA